MVDVTSASYGPYRLAAAVLAEPTQDPLVVLDSRPWAGDVGVQLARTDAVISERHLVASFYAAATTMMAGVARSRRIEVEFLLRLTARRQIADALRVAGLRGGESEVLLVVISWGNEDPSHWLRRIAETLGGELRPVRLDRDIPRAGEIFGLTETQLEATPPCSYADPFELLVIEKTVASYIE